VISFAREQGYFNGEDEEFKGAVKEMVDVVKEMIKSVMISEHNEKDSRNTSKREISYREYTRYKAIEIWKEHIMWGVGPSMYGGSLSIKYNSPYYGYNNNFMPIVAAYMKQWGTIDQFWPQVLAELGIIGITLFTIFFISICMMLLSFKKKAQSPEVKKIFDGLIIYFIVILISTAVLSLNLTPVLFSYFAFVGIASGYIIRLS